MTKEITKIEDEIDEIDEELKQALAITAKEESSLEKSDIRFLSIKGSRFSLGDDKLGKELNVVVLASAYDNAFYDMPYDPDVIRPPACFALSFDNTQMVPDPSSPSIQAESCSVCPNNEFGSSGKGKACKNGRRLVLASVDANGVDLSSTVTLRLPPTSLKNYSSYVRKLASNSMPVFSVETAISFDENETYPKLIFKSVGTLAPSEIKEIIEQRNAFADIALTPYDVSTYTEPAQASSKLQ